MTVANEVTVEIDDGVAVVTIDRPHARNAIATGTMDALDSALTALDTADVHVLVLRGAGDRAFVSGGDLKELAAIRDEDGAVEMALRMRRFLDRLALFPAPVIAAINGHAIGGGAEVAVAADIRVASEDARIGFTQARLGIMPAWGGAERLAELVGRSRAMLLVATGQTLTAEEAAGVGLVDALFPRKEFDAGWRSIASDFASLAPGAAHSIKHVIAAAKPHVHAALEAEASARFARLWAAEAHWEAHDRLLAERSNRAPA